MQTIGYIFFVLLQVQCRDCHKETETVFHVLGLKCTFPECGSYNTVRCGNEEIPEDAVPVRTQEFQQFIQRGRNEPNEDDHEQTNGEDDDG